MNGALEGDRLCNGRDIDVLHLVILALPIRPALDGMKVKLEGIDPKYPAFLFCEFVKGLMMQERGHAIVRNHHDELVAHTAQGPAHIIYPPRVDKMI